MKIDPQHSLHPGAFSNATTPSEVFENWHRVAPEAPALTVEASSGDAVTELDHAALGRRVSALAAQLEQWSAPGERVVLPFENTAGFVVAYFACLRAGLIAVPAPLKGEGARLSSIMRNCAPSLILCDPDARGALPLDPDDGLANVTIRTLDEVTSDDAKPSRPYPSADAIATLQYTSGSTSEPKGVCLTHANIISNWRNMTDALQTGPQTVTVSWLPLFHDMGLFGGMVQTLMGGGRVVLLPRSTSLRNPLRWIEAISRHQATHSGAPDFAFAACTAALERQARPPDLDLSAWRVAWSGAEPVRPGTLTGFAAAFARFGFRAEAYNPAYGMAEATLIVTTNTSHGLVPIKRFLHGLDNVMVPAPPDASGGTAIVSNGSVVADTQLRIVAPDTDDVLPDGHVGEVCIAGPQVAARYWDRPLPVVALTEAGEKPTHFMRSGDLGFLSDGELYLTGRHKDVIIRHGRNIHPEDIEFYATAASPKIQPGYVAAFTTWGATNTGDPDIVLAIGQRRQVDRQTADEIIAHVRQTISKALDVIIDRVILVPRSDVARTSSGKIRRHEMREKYLSGALTCLNESRADEAPVAVSADPQRTGDVIMSDLLHEVRALAGAPEHLRAPIDFDAPLYAQGFDSLQLLQLSGLIEERTGTTPPDTLLAERTPRDIADWIHTQEPVDKRSWVRDAQQQPWPAQLRMTREQAALYFADEGKWRAVALMPLVLSSGPDDRSRLASVIDRLVARHPHLSMRAVSRAAGPVFIAPPKPLTSNDVLDWLDPLSDGAGTQKPAGPDALERALWLRARAPLDLGNGPGLRLVVGPDCGGARALVLAVHHLICDGRSLELLTRELATLWSGGALDAVNHNPFALLETEEADLSGSSFLDALQRRVETLKGLPSQIDPPWPRPAQDQVIDTGIDTGLPAIRFQLPQQISNRVARLAQAQGVGLPAVYLAAWHAALMRLGVPQAPCITVAQALRDSTRPGTGPSYAVRPTPVCLGDTSEDRDVDRHTLLHRAQNRLTDARASEPAPYPLVIDSLDVPRDGPYAPFMQFHFGHLRQATPPHPGLSQALDAAKRSKTPQTFLLPQMEHSGLANLQIVESKSAICAVLIFDPQHVHRATASSLQDTFLAALDHILNAPADTPFCDIDLPSPAVRVGPPPQLPPDFEPIHVRARRIATGTPDAAAVIEPAFTATNAHLWRKVDDIAAALGDHRGVVAVILPRGFDLLAAQLAVLQVGSICLPIDMETPEERMGEMLEDAAPVAILTNAKGCTRLSHAPRILDVCALRSQDTMAPLPTITEGDAAYLLYTSGSTGRPKGVIFGHSALRMRISALCDQMNMRQGDRMLGYISPGFDPSVQELMMAAHSGATLVVVPQDGPFDPEAAASILAREKVTHLTGLPSTLRAIAEQPQFANCTDLIAISCGGEALGAGLRALLTKGKSVRLLNVYGPTETIICATTRDVTDVPAPEVVAVGFPLPATTSAVVDDRGHPVAIGVIGEIAISGPTCGDRYLNRPEQNARSFRQLTLSNGNAETAYLTGDMGWMDHNGLLWIVGRRDNQLKISGQRIEPEEIAQRLMAIDGIAEAYVRAVQSETQIRLVAYLVAEPTAPDPENLRAILAKGLSAPLVPRDFVFLPQFPLTINGKVDGRALPLPDTGLAADKTWVGDPLDHRLHQLWCETLRLNTIEPDASFFDLGGHSLLAFKLVARIEREFNQTLPANTLYRAPTIRRMAEILRRGRASAFNAESQSNGTGLTRLRDGGVLAPLVLVSPGSSGDLALTDFARNFTPGRAIFLLSGGRDARAETMQRLAQNHLETLAQGGLNGPIHIAGYSIAGWTAFALAEQAQAAGVEVTSLALIDPPGSAGIRTGRRAFAVLRRIPGLAAVLGRHSATGTLLWLAQDDRIQAQLTLVSRYTPDRAPDRLSVALTGLGRPLRAAFWRRIAANVTIAALPGSHSSIVAGPQADTLVKWLEQIMQQAEGPKSWSPDPEQSTESQSP
ncbi:AMP-binding protein [Aestuariivita sp.]|jgi:nonribosomal peptide synthetase protein BlmVI|uniref:AMP-binding protein n=1 Tax=Aestuariivita sp. TaxID=1872407 RepID=UPI0021723E04|nr:AMP-binding protein [Aestuariivita sp.]MCE8007099.1 AMP-binding protein [Aestuariivita sp.]